MKLDSHLFRRCEITVESPLGLNGVGAGSCVDVAMFVVAVVDQTVTCTSEPNLEYATRHPGIGEQPKPR